MNCSLEEFVYPVIGTFQLEIDVQKLRFGRWYSELTKIGGARWYIKAQECWSMNYDSNSLQINLGLVNSYYGKTFTKNSEDWEDLRYGETIEITKLLNDGFIIDEKFKIECAIEVLSKWSAKWFICPTRFRPDENDVATMLATSRYKPTRKLIEMVFDISELKNNPFFSRMTYIDGVPCELEIWDRNRKKNFGMLNVSLHVNTRDESKWWRVTASTTFIIINQKNESMSICESINPTTYDTKSSSETVRLIYWRELLDPESDFVEDGRVTIGVYITIHEKYGFDEKTGKGFDKPMKIITDAMIKVEDEECYVSRMVLSHQSKWFCDLFSKQPEETKFNLSDVSADSFSKLLGMICNVATKWSESKMIEILQVIEKYQADECFKKLDYGKKSIYFGDSIRTLKMIDKYNLPNMKAMYIEKLKNHKMLIKLFQDPDIGELSTKFRKELTSDEVVEREDRIDEPFYVYSNELETSDKIADSKEILQKFLVKNEEAKNMLENPAVQNTGKDILNLFAENKQSGVCQISFKKFSDPSDKVTFNLKDNKIFYSSKQFLANASRYFLKRYFGPNAKCDDNTMVIDEVTSKDFNLLLSHVYYPGLPITEKNLAILLPLAHCFSFFKVWRKCEKYLIKTEKMTVDEKENYAKRYNLEYLLNACKNFKKQQQEK